VLQHRTRPLGGRRPVTKLATLLALLLLAAIPAVAEAKNFKVDGRVKGAPAAKGGSVSLPLQLTKQSSRKLNLGTRNVRVSIKRRARLPLSGSGAQGASRLRATGLRAGDRLKGITSLTRKAKRRMRYIARPKLKLKRARVIRKAPRQLAPPGPGAAPAAPRTLEQALSEMSGRVMALNAKVGEFGTIPQQIEARKLQLEGLSLGLEGITNAFETLTANLEAREGTVDQLALEALLANVEALVLRVEGVEASTAAVDTLLGALESSMGTVGGTLEELALMAPLLSTQAALIRQFPGAEAQIMAIDAALLRIESRLGAAESALAAIGSSTDGLNASMASFANAVNAQASVAVSADLGTIQAGVNGLAGGVGSLEASFAALQSLNGSAAAVAGLEGDAIALQGMVEALCTTLPTACP
jgi:Tfp pilus assembly protein PilN